MLSRSADSANSVELHGVVVGGRDDVPSKASGAAGISSMPGIAVGVPAGRRDHDFRVSGRAAGVSLAGVQPADQAFTERPRQQRMITRDVNRA
jgi:hypothetical protein